MKKNSAKKNGSVVPSLEEIIKRTIKAIEDGKSQIFDIAENARTEAERTQAKLADVKKKVVEVIKEVEKSERLEKAARIRLMEVNRDLKNFNEETIKKAYQNASDLQAKVKILRNTEKSLIAERSELEQQYKRNQETVAKAEQLVSQVGVALDYLMSNIQGINNKLEEIEARGSLGSRVIKAQEEERRRVAREIHDGPAQSMANIVLRAEFLEKLMEKDIILAKQEINQLKVLVRNSLKDVRKIIYDLRPMALDDLGLVPAVCRYIEEFIARTNIKVKFLPSRIEKRLANTLEVAIFRVIQEALQNAYKHANAASVEINLQVTDEDVVLEINDNGKGFVVEEVLVDNESESYGILGMRERVELLGGQFNIQSAPGQGAQIAITIPVQSSNEE